MNMSRSLNVVCLFGVAAIFKSLLYEACGRILNPIDGLLRLLLSGNWAVCEAGVESILPIRGLISRVILWVRLARSYRDQ